MSRPGRSLRESLVVPALVLHAASWVAVVAHGHDWVGCWLNGVDQVAGSVVIVGPLLAGLTADSYARSGRTSVPELVVTSVRPARAWYGTAIRLWLLAGANLTVVTAEVAVLVRLAGVPLSSGPLLIVPLGALVLACHALIGMAVGLRLAPRLAGAVAGTVAFAVFLLAVPGLAPRSFVIGGATDSLAGQRYRPSVLLALAAAAVAAAVAIAALTWWSSRRSRLRVALMVGALAGAMALSTTAGAAARFESAQVPLVCRGSSPEVCLTADAPRPLVDASDGMRRRSRPLVGVGAALPARWAGHGGPASDPGVGMLTLTGSAELATTVSDHDLIRSLARPSTCAAYFDELDVGRSAEVQYLLERWIAFRNGLGDTEHADRWFASGASEAWVRTTYAQLRQCDLAGLRLPSRVP